MRLTAKQIGDLGEIAAKKFLEKKGWRILSEKFASGGGEIDLIGYRFGVLVFFEVKTRSNKNFGSGTDAVDGEKLQRINKAAKMFLKAYCSGGKVPVFYPFGIEKKRTVRKTRTDVIEIYLSPDKKAEAINHIKNWGVQL